MRIVDGQPGESIEDALARDRRETAEALGKRIVAEIDRCEATARRRGDIPAQMEQAQAVETPAEVARLAAEPGPEERYQDEQDPEVREGWHIDNLSSLDWALSRIADLRQEQAENEALVQEQIDRLKLRLDKLSKPIAHGIAFFEGRIREYALLHKDELLKGGKKKSRTLPSGSIGWRKTGGGLTVTDREALLDWARQQPVELELIRIKEEPAVDAVKRAFKASGEVPPGCDVAPEDEEVTIKTGEK